MEELMEFIIPKEANFDLVDPREYNYWKLRKHNIFVIDWELDESYQAIELAKTIMLLNAEAKDTPTEELGNILLLIHSFGGDLDQAQALCDIIEASRIPVITVCMGVAMSAGFLIFLAGKRRYAFSQSQFLIHSGSASFEGTAEQIEQSQKNYKRQLDQMKKYILEHTSISEKLFTKNRTKDWYVDSTEAKELGICKVIKYFDEII